jgi:nucleotide sugar dehydrogenase
VQVAVIGAGKMGLPLAAQFARQGAQVWACDVREETVARINAGTCPLDEPGLPELVAEQVAAGRLRATSDTAAAVAECAVVVVIVPALLTDDRHADLSLLESASRDIARGLRPDTLVCYETTVPVGTTRKVFRPLLDQAGVPYALAYSPERVKSRTVLRQLTLNPKVVGGFDEESARRAEAFYKAHLGGAPVINVHTLENAEFVKIAGMVYRDVNIALANELARYAETAGLDLPGLLSAINTDGEAHLLQPGLGVGGHCTPIYPYFLLHDARERGLDLQLPRRARQVNDDQAGHLVARLCAERGDLQGRAVLICGLAFRPEVKEHICSTAFLLRDALIIAGARVSLHDPLYTPEEITAHGFTPGSLDRAPLPEIVIFNTAHEVYRRLHFNRLKEMGVRLVVDGRNFIPVDNIRRMGLVHVSVGRPVAHPPEPPRPA